MWSSNDKLLLPCNTWISNKLILLFWWADCVLMNIPSRITNINAYCAMDMLVLVNVAISACPCGAAPFLILAVQVAFHHAKQHWTWVCIHNNRTWLCILPRNLTEVFNYRQRQPHNVAGDCVRMCLWALCTESQYARNLKVLMSHHFIGISSEAWLCFCLELTWQRAL